MTLDVVGVNVGMVLAFLVAWNLLLVGCYALVLWDLLNHRDRGVEVRYE